MRIVIIEVDMERCNWCGRLFAWWWRHLPPILDRGLLGAWTYRLGTRGHGPWERPASQAWFWQPGWQEREREADADLKAGRYVDYDDAEAMLAALNFRGGPVTRDDEPFSAEPCSDGCDLSLAPNVVGGLGRCPDCGWFYRIYEKGYDQRIQENAAIAGVAGFRPDGSIIPLSEDDPEGSPG